MVNRHSYTKEEDKFLIDNVKGITLKELTERFNSHFNTNVTENGIAGRKTKLGLKSGITGGRFKKGNVPFNKGIKWDDYMPQESRQRSLQTCFKKGNRPTQYKDIGSELVGKDGYIFVKIDDKAYERRNNWRPKQWIVYEKHYGPVPKGYVVIFADGDIHNYDIDNLVLATKGEVALMNKLNLRSVNKDITKSGHAIAKLRLKIRDKEKELKE